MVHISNLESINTLVVRQDLWVISRGLDFGIVRLDTLTKW